MKGPEFVCAHVPASASAFTVISVTTANDQLVLNFSWAKGAEVCNDDSVKYYIQVWEMKKVPTVLYASSELVYNIENNTYYVKSELKAPVITQNNGQYSIALFVQSAAGRSAPVSAVCFSRSFAYDSSLSSALLCLATTRKSQMS